MDEQAQVRQTVRIAAAGVFVAHLPLNAVSTSLATIAASTGADSTQLQWVTDAYIVPMAAAVLSAGVFGDIYGRRRVFTLGLVLAAMGGTIAAMSGLAGGLTLAALWAGQAIAGLGGGLLLPTTLALITNIVPDPRQRGRYIATWATGTVAALAVGPLVSGSILSFADWGWVFAPAALLAVALGIVGLRRLPESSAPEGRRLDWPGQITAVITILGFIFGAIEGGDQGWGSPPALMGFGVGVAALAAFIWVELRTTAPLIELRMFQIPAFSAATFAAAAVLFSIVGVMFLTSLFLGTVQQLSPIEIAIRIVFVAGVAALINPLVGRMMVRVPAMGVLLIGLALGVTGVLFISQISDDTVFIDLIWRLAIFGVANALMLTSLTTVAVNSVPNPQAGMASATSTALRQFGGTLGPAIIGSIYISTVRDGQAPAAAFSIAMVSTAAVLAAAFLACAAAAISGTDITERRRRTWISTS